VNDIGKRIVRHHLTVIRRGLSMSAKSAARISLWAAQRERAVRICKLIDSAQEELNAIADATKGAGQ